MKYLLGMNDVEGNRVSAILVALNTHLVNAHSKTLIHTNDFAKHSCDIFSTYLHTS